jgi:hypothetical protein
MKRQIPPPPPPTTILKGGFPRPWWIKDHEQVRTMTKQQDDAIYSAYLGIHVLRAMCRAVKLPLGVKRSTELIIELEQAFPTLKEEAHDNRHHRDRRARSDLS